METASTPTAPLRPAAPRIRTEYGEIRSPPTPHLAGMLENTDQKNLKTSQKGLNEGTNKELNV